MAGPCFVLHPIMRNGAADRTEPHGHVFVRDFYIWSRRSNFPVSEPTTPRLTLPPETLQLMKIMLDVD
jgi:hypothetical protein